MHYKNISNGHIESEGGTFSWLWCLLFGPFYFLFRDNLKHFFLWPVFLGITFGISWLIYPFLVYKINRHYYLHRGWVEVSARDIRETMREREEPKFKRQELGASEEDNK